MNRKEGREPTGKLRVLVLGARGMLGTDLVEVLSPFHQVISVDQEDFDVADEISVLAAIGDIKPATIINCAAITDVDGCERDPGKAFAVNANGAGYVARAAAECGAHLVYISTDFVFDGEKSSPYEEGDEPNPLSVYGKSKLAGEKESLAWCPGCLIIRTAWLFGRNGKNFVDTIVKCSAESESIEVVNDQTGCPTYSVDLSEAIATLIRRETSGTLNVTNSGHCSWWEYACYIVDLLGSGCVVSPTSSEQLGRPAARPAYSVLSSSQLKAELGTVLRPWREAVKAYIDSKAF